MFNYFKLLNLFRENRPIFMTQRRAGAAAKAKAEAAEQPGATAGTPETEAKVTTETKKGLAEAKHDVGKSTTGEKTKKEIKDLRERVEAAKKDINVMQLSRDRRDKNIDVNSLVPNTEEGIANVEKVFKNKFLLSGDIVDWMGEEMRKALKMAESAESDEKRQLFVNAEQYLNQCKDVFGEGFYYAFSYFKDVKDLAGKYQTQDKTLTDNLRKKDSDPIIGSIVDKGTELAHDIVKSVEEGNYEKMALYGIAAYSFYKIWDKWIGPKLSSNKEGDFPWGSVLLAGAGAYCGLSIFAPNTLKKLWGKGVHADAKGTAAEDLIGLLKENPAAAEKGVEIGVLAAISQANVKDVFAPMLSFEGNMRYDTASSDAGMIQLTNPGLARYFDSETIAAGPIYPDRPPFSKRTPMQKVYAKACEQLYKSAMWLKQEWDTRVLAGKTPAHDRKFEDAFLKETSGNFKMADLYRKLGTFSASVVPEMPWTDDLKDEAEKFLNGEAGGKGMFEKTDNVEIKQLEPNFMKIRVRGFPFVVKLKGDSDGTRQYLFFPAGDDFPSATPLATVDTKNPESIKEGALAVTRKVDARMDELLANYEIEGARGNEVKKYEEGKWFAEVEMPGVPKHKIPARRVKAVIQVDMDGESLKFLSPTTSEPIYFVSNEMKENNDYAPQVLNAIVGQERFNALRPMLLSNKMRLGKDPADTNEFDLLFTEGLPSLRMMVDKDGNYSSVDPEAEKELLQSEVFRKTYVEAFAEQYLGFFENMRKQVDKMPQSYFLYFPESMTKWFSGLKADKWLNADSDVISGSIPNYFTYMLIDSKRDALKYRLFWKMAEAGSFEEVEKAKSGIFDQLTLMEHFANGKFLETMKGKNRDSWSRDEFMIKIVEPFRSTGVSRIYLSSIDYFENSIFKKIGYNGERGGDISEKSHALAGQLLSAFYYYTAEHDTNFKEGSPEEIKFENYCHYVADELFNQYEEPTKLTPNIPPENFKILRFNEWERVTPNPEKLKDVDDAEGVMTVEQIKTKLAEDYSEVVSTLQKSYGVKVNLKYLQETLAEFGQKDNRFDLHSKAIFDQTHGRRSNQVSLMQKYKMDFINELYEDNKVWNNLSAKETFDVYVRKFWK